MSSVSALNSLLASGSSASSSGIDLSSILSAATGATSTGIDVNAAVDAALYAARAPERQWQAQQATLQSQTTTLTSIQAALKTLTSDLNALNDPQGAIGSNTVASSSPTQVSAVASPSATPGQHVVTVQHIATAASWYSSPLMGGNSATGSSSLQITLANGQQTTFALGQNGTNTLSSLAKTINASGLGLSASVIQDATGARLALVSQATGKASDFSVTELATSSQNWTSAQVATASTPLGGGTYQMGDGSTTASFTVPQGSSLSDVVTQINGLGLNLTASISTNASGAFLSVQAGNGGTVQVSADPALSLTQSSTATDASLAVDGIPVTSASNTVTGALQGVSINIQGSAPGTQVSLNVTPGTDAITSLMQQFVSDYNSAVSLVNSQFSLNAGSNTQGVLGSDPTVRALQSVLLGVTTYQSASGAGAASTLRSFGLSVNDDGTLTLDASKLTNSLQTNPGGLETFLQGSALNGFANSAAKQLKLYSDPSTGVLNVDLQNLSRQYSTLQSEIADFESGYIASQKTVLTSMYSKAEIALQQLPAQLKSLQAQLSNGSGN